MKRFVVEALSEIARRRPDAILTDSSMHYLDGVDVFRSLKNHPDTSGIPIYIVPRPGQPWPHGSRFPWFPEWTEFSDDGDDDETQQ